MSLNDRLDSLMALDAPADTPAPPDVSLDETQTSDEPVQVAGLGKVLRDLLKKDAPAATPAPATTPAIPTPTPAAPPSPALSTKPPPTATQQKAGEIFPPVKPDVVTPPAQPPVEKIISPADAVKIDQKAAARVAAGDAASGKPPEELFNTLRTGLSDDANTFVDEVAKAAGVKAPTRVTHAEVLKDLQEMGYKPKDIDWITNYADNTEQMRKVAMAREALVATAKMTQDLAKQLTATPTPELAAKYHQATVLLGELSRGVKNIGTDHARALGIMRATPEGDTNALIQFVNNIGGLDDVVAHAGKLAKLDMTNIANAKRAADLADVSMLTKAKNIWVTTWINGLLSSPITHAKNIMGNELFAVMQVPERGVAAAIGKLRGADVGDRVEAGEAMAMLHGLIGGQMKGMEAFATSFANNASVTGTLGKLDDAGATVSNFGDYLGLGGMVGRSANLYGKAVTLPGRALMAEDEFFKTQGYFMELYAQASRRSASVYDDAIRAGKSPADAKAAQKAAYLDVLDNPPADINAASWDAAKYMTFTEDLEHKWLRGLQSAAAESVVVRAFMPFIRTPVNIAAATLERTPFALFAKPFWQEYRKGGIARDMALAKVATGTSIVTTGATLASMGRITGSGPNNPGEREALKNSGWQPYSIVFFKDEVDAETRKLLGTYGRITETNDKVFWSYQGIEPLGGMLGMTADYADFARYSDKDEDISQMGHGIAYALSTYTMELPYLQGMAEFVKTLTGGGGGNSVTKDSAARMLNALQKTATSFLIGGSPAGAWSSAQAVAERMINPDASDTKVPRGTEFKGVYEAINLYKSRVPGLSASLPPLTNRWGEVVRYGDGALHETVSPIRVKEGQQKDVDRVWLEYNLPRGQPSRKVGWAEHGGMSGISVELTAEQFNELKRIYGNSGVQEDIVREAKNPAFQRLSIRDQQARLNKINDNYMTAARSQLVNDSKFSKELQAQFEDKKFKADTYGIYSDQLD